MTTNTAPMALTSTNSPKLIKASFLVSVKKNKGEIYWSMTNKSRYRKFHQVTYELRDSICYRGAWILHNVVEELFHALFLKWHSKSESSEKLEIQLDTVPVALCPSCRVWCIVSKAPRFCDEELNYMQCVIFKPNLCVTS